LPETIAVIPDEEHADIVDHFPKKEVDMEEFVDLVLKQREMYEEMDPREREVWKEIPTDKNILIGFIGDIHADNRNCDLELFLKHISIVQEEPLIYLGFLGDSLSNFHAKHIDGIHERDLTTEGGRMLVSYLFRKVADRWLFMGHGDHELHEMEAAGWNFIQELHKHFPHASYIGNMGIIHIGVGGQVYHLAAAHRMMGYSQWNPLHPHIRWLKDHSIEEVDAIIGAHQHRKGNQEISHSGHKVTFIQTAPYIRTDAYARRLGYDEKTRSSMGMQGVILSGKYRRVIPFYHFEDGVTLMKALNAYEASGGKVWVPGA
jgi:hypothetical protein